NDGRDCWHGADPLSARHPLPLLARLASRSGRSASLRVRPVQDATSRPVLQLQEVRRTFKQGDRQIPGLTGAAADLHAGQATALVGPSGAGKSTLLHIAGLLETPDGGRVLVNGVDCAGLSDGERTRVRRREMGFVYQFHQLLPEFTALENVLM